MPPKRKLKELLGFDILDNDKTEQLFYNSNAMYDEMTEYVKGKYDIKLPEYSDDFLTKYFPVQEREVRTFMGSRNSKLVKLMSDPIYQKYINRIITLNKYFDNSANLAEKRNIKETENLASDIIKRNIKQFIVKKKAKAEIEAAKKKAKAEIEAAKKKAKVENEAATKIQYAFQASKSQRRKNVTKVAKREKAKLKAEVIKKRKPETAAAKDRRLKKIAIDIADSRLSNAGRAIVEEGITHHTLMQ
jgi:oligoribonuclease NrnB/cAMP/cGMP phosphodiesterase (DHH superfamily)